MDTQGQLHILPLKVHVFLGKEADGDFARQFLSLGRLEKKPTILALFRGAAHEGTLVNQKLAQQLHSKASEVVRKFAAVEEPPQVVSGATRVTDKTGPHEYYFRKARLTQAVA